MELRINGVYSSEVIHACKSHGVEIFGFDLRPKSFNFIQLHQIEKIINETDTGKEIYTFIFSKEKDYIMDEFLRKISNFLDPSRFLIEFSNHEDIYLISHIKHNSILYLSDFSQLLEIKNNLKVLSISHNDLNNTFQDKEVIKQITKFKQSLIDIRIDWDESINHGLFELINFNSLCLEISRKIEKSYRCIDFNLLNNLIEYYLKQFKMDKI